MVFFGEYTVSFTGKNRVVLPKKIRDIIANKEFVVSKGFDTCLNGYTVADWEARSKELLQVSLLEKENLDKKRFLFSSTVYIEADSQGRCVLPQHLMQYASLLEEKEVVIVGVGDHFEIWNIKKWNTYVNTIQ